MFVRFVPAIIWAVLIFIGSSIPGPEIPQAPTYTSYVAHFFEFSVLGFLLAYAYQEKKSNGKYINILLIGLLYALSDELHQLFVVGRNFEMVDLVLDAVGLVVGIGIYLKMSKTAIKFFHKNT